MNPNLSLLVLAGVSFVSPVGHGDVVLVRTSPAKGAPVLRLLLHDTEGAALPGSLEVVSKPIGKVSGKSPVRHLFAADWDGDGRDELIRITERVGDEGRLDLAILSPPTAKTKKAKLLAKAAKGSVGSTKPPVLLDDPQPVVAAGSVDPIGDGVDRLMLARDEGAFTFLSVHEFPATHGDPLGPLALMGSATTSFGTKTRAVTGFSADDDPAEEVVLVTAESDGTELLRLHDGFTGLLFEPLPALVPPVQLLPLAGVTTSSTRVDADGDGTWELLLSRALPDGRTQLLVFGRPTDGVLGPPILEEFLPADAPVELAFGLDRKVGPEDEDEPVIAAPATWALEAVEVDIGGDVVHFHVTKLADVLVTPDGTGATVTLPGGAPLHFVAPTPPLAGHVTFEGGTFVFPIHLEGLGSGTVTTTFPAGEQWTSSNGTTIETTLTFEPIGGIEFAHGWSPEIHQVRLRRPDP